MLTLLHSEWPKLQGVLAILSAIELNESLQPINKPIILAKMKWICQKRNMQEKESFIAVLADTIEKWNLS